MMYAIFLLVPSGAEDGFLNSTPVENREPIPRFLESDHCNPIERALNAQGCPPIWIKFLSQNKDDYKECCQKVDDKKCKLTCEQAITEDTEDNGENAYCMAEKEALNNIDGLANEGVCSEEQKERLKERLDWANQNFDKNHPCDDLCSQLTNCKKECKNLFKPGGSSELGVNQRKGQDQGDSTDTQSGVDTQSVGGQNQGSTTKAPENRQGQGQGSTTKAPENHTQSVGETDAAFVDSANFFRCLQDKEALVLNKNLKAKNVADRMRNGQEESAGKTIGFERMKHTKKLFDLEQSENLHFDAGPEKNHQPNTPLQQNYAYFSELFICADNFIDGKNYPEEGCANHAIGLLWKESKEMDCAISEKEYGTADGMSYYYAACRYSPRNYYGDLKANVGTRKCKKSKKSCEEKYGLTVDETTLNLKGDHLNKWNNFIKDCPLE